MKFIIPIVLCLICNFVCAIEAILGTIKNVNVERISDTSRRVSWDAVPGSKWNDEINYAVEIKDPDSYESRIHYFHHSNCPNLHCSLELMEFSANVSYSIGVHFKTEDSVGTHAERGGCNASSDELHLSWEDPTQKSLDDIGVVYIVESYNITYAPSHQFYSDDKKEHIVTSAKELVLYGLKKNTNYSINVLATIAGGFGVHSTTFNCSTEEDVPDEPVDVKVVVYGTNKVKVLWHEPLETNGKIMHYTIYYRKKGGESNMAMVLADKTQHEIIGLETNETYEFWVTASNNVGEGLASKYVTATPRNETPAQIASLGGKVYANFNEYQFSLPCVAVGSPKPTLLWKVGDESRKTNSRIQTLFDGTLLIQFVDRKDAKNYTCVVQNEFGNDSITYEVIVLAPPLSPEITILSTTTDEITLELKRNSTDTAHIDGFILFYKLDTDIANVKGVNVKSQPYKISNCRCGSSYRIYALGYNGRGNGYDSQTLTVRTNGTKPIASTMSEFLEPSADAVTLHLSTWKTGGCPISHFFVEYKEKVNIEWIKIRKRLQSNADFILNLKPATLYDVRVTAHNSAGTTVVDYEVATLTK